MITNSQRKLTPLLDAAINESIKLINQYIPPDVKQCIYLYEKRLINIFKQAGYIYNTVIEDMIIKKIKFSDAKIDHKKIIETMIEDDPYAPYYITTHPVDVPNHITYTYNDQVYTSKTPLTQSDLHILDQLPGTATGIITVELANIISQKYKNYHPIGDFNTIVLQSIVDIIMSRPKPDEIRTTDRVKSYLVDNYFPDYCYFMKDFIYVSNNPISYVELKRQYNMFKIYNLLGHE